MTVKVKKATGMKKKVPPDGGWGWWIVFAYIITGMTCIPIIQNFGLIYKRRLQDLGLTSTDITTIVSMNSSIGQILGIFQSPLLKRFGFRVMAAFGVAAFTLGTFLTGLSFTFTHFLITHGIITSIGFTYTLTSFSIAINSYFKKKRSRISGILLGFTGIGPVILPQFVAYVLGIYGTIGTSFILAGLTAHSFIGASLLRPVEQYMKDSEDDEEEMPKVESGAVLHEEDSLSCYNVTARRRPSGAGLIRAPRSVSESEAGDSVIALDPKSGLVLETLREQEEKLLPLPKQPKVGSQYNLYSEKDEVADGMKSTLDLINIFPPLNFASVETLDSITHYSVENLTADSRSSSEESIYELTAPKGIEQMKVQIKEEEIAAAPKRKKTGWRKLAAWFNRQFDLDLLKDGTYLLITLGLSVAIIGELMFSILTPFILYEVGMDLQMTAYFMSISAVADIVSRFVSPYIAECIKLDSPRVMYIIALFCLLLTRASLLFVRGTIGLGIVATTVGFAKGVRTVFWGLVLPHHVPMEKLGSAMSFQNLINGLLIIVAGPMSGLVVEINNSYLNIIYVSNAMTGLTILIWGFEYAYKTCRKSYKR